MSLLLFANVQIIHITFLSNIPLFWHAPCYNPDMQSETTYPAIIGRILAYERGKRGWDQEKMAAKVGLNRSSWSRIENGETVLNAVLLDKIAGVFGMPPSQILIEADEARRKLEAEGVQVHSEKRTKVSSGNVGVGLALLGTMALGGLVASVLAKDKKGGKKS